MTKVDHDSASTWERIFRSRAWGRYPQEHVVRFVARNFCTSPAREQIRLLELGCGPGANVWFMAREGFSVSGIDASSTAIEQARMRLRDENLNAELVVGDFSQLPWSESCFDAVVDNVSLYCNPSASIRKAMTEVLRVLKPGGKFLSSFFSERTWGYGLGQMTEPDGFSMITEGPIAGTGYAFFLRKEKVADLFAQFVAVNVERASWTLDCETHLIEQLIITCSKP